MIVPHQVDTFVCPWCGSTLHPAGGVRIHRLREKPRLSEAAAGQALRAWFAGPDVPRDMERQTQVHVGPLQYFPFLRARRRGLDTAEPLAPLPAPELAGLSRVAAELEAVPTTQAPVDEDIVRDQLKTAVADPDVTELLIEERAYYPARYTYQGERYSAVVDASGGRVHTERRPVGRRTFGEGRVALIVAGMLFAEALVVPGPVGKVAAIMVSAGALYPVIRWAVARYG
ncbi:MAG: hypothetical protein M5U22_12095 [Thermoleophilia bacterium]|nr:hypothetical protein [Thermoleophilia bacterium]